MLGGIVILCWGILCFYAAFFTKNKYTFFVSFPPNHSFKGKSSERANKIRNIIGGIIFLLAGLILIEQNRT